MDVKIHRLLGMGGPERGEERGQAVKFSLGIESFAGTSHAGNSQVIHYLNFWLIQCSQRLYGLWCSKRGLGELLSWGKARMENFVRSIHIVEVKIGYAWEGDKGGAVWKVGGDSGAGGGTGGRGR